MNAIAAFEYLAANGSVHVFPYHRAYTNYRALAGSVAVFSPYLSTRQGLRFSSVYPAARGETSHLNRSLLSDQRN